MSSFLKLFLRITLGVLFFTPIACSKKTAPPSAQAFANIPYFHGVNATTYSLDIDASGGSQAGALVPNEVDASLALLVADGVKHVEIVCRASMATATSTSLSADSHDLSDSDLNFLIQEIKRFGMIPILKLHIYIGGSGSGRSQIGISWENDLASETAWFSAYRDYLMKYVNLAVSYHLPYFIIATELPGIVLDTAITGNRRDSEWRNLIATIRSQYLGKLTYAANVSSFNRMSWWDALDFIGVDAYFELTTQDAPSLETLESSWTNCTDPTTLSVLGLSGSVNLVKILADLSAKFNRPIVFTEIGYQSSNKAASHINDGAMDWISEPVNNDLQRNLYQALIDNVASQPWFKGAFTWFWYPGSIDTSKLGYLHQHAYQGKPAELTLSAWMNK